MSNKAMDAAVCDPRTMTGPIDAVQLRLEVDRLIAAGQTALAAGLLTELWQKDKTGSAASLVTSRFEQLRPTLNLLPYRVAILRSYTVEPLVPILKASTFTAGIDLKVHISAFNAHAQEILDPSSLLYAFSPDAVILVVQTRDIAPELWRDFGDLDTKQIAEVVKRVLSDFQSWIGSFRCRSNAHLVVHNLEQPLIPSQGILDTQTRNSQTEAIDQINRELKKIVAEQSGVYVLDYDALVARHGRLNWQDERKWLTVRLPMTAQNLNHLAGEWLRFLHPLSGKIAKACVVDLDNTMWGGIIGEDGMSGIKLGQEYPGASFRALQRALLDLHQRGILLAVCSKNNYDDAIEALQNHPGMLLKPSHFAAIRINWTEKAQNLREIAKELNIGIDALAFVDDNPIERQQVRSQVPEAHVLELPGDPMEFARAVRECPLFERLTLSAEDRQRGAMYQAQQEREQLAQTIASREDFLRSLQQEAEIAPLTKATLARIAQLTNKTNQFNLTTRRYNEQQLLDITAKGCDCFSIRVRDRFGDNGIVGVTITRHDGDNCEIDTFLLSCRVIGRSVESAFLAFLVEHGRQRGAKRLRGWFVPTKKNAPARDFYPSHGFQSVQQTDNGTLWSLDLAADSLPCPEWVKLHLSNGDQ